MFLSIEATRFYNACMACAVDIMMIWSKNSKTEADIGASHKGSATGRLSCWAVLEKRATRVNLKDIAAEEVCVQCRTREPMGRTSKNQ